MNYKLESIQQFLTAQNWEKRQSTEKYDCYYSSSINGTENYLEVPRNTQNANLKTAIDALIKKLQKIYQDKYDLEDFETFFTTKNCILTLQLEDEITHLTKMQLERVKNIQPNMSSVIKKTLIFEVTGANIFGKAPNDDSITECH